MERESQKEADNPVQLRKQGDVEHFPDPCLRVDEGKSLVQDLGTKRI